MTPTGRARTQQRRSLLTPVQQQLALGIGSELFRQAGSNHTALLVKTCKRVRVFGLVANRNAWFPSYFSFLLLDLSIVVCLMELVK